MTHIVRPAPTTRTPLFPRTTLGWLCVGLGGVPLVLFGLIMFVFPVVGMIFGIDEINIEVLNTWITPVAMAVLLLASAATGMLAHRRGERATTSELTMWVSLAFGALLAVFLVGGALGGA